MCHIDIVRQPDDLLHLRELFLEKLQHLGVEITDFGVVAEQPCVTDASAGTPEQAVFTM